MNGHCKALKVEPVAKVHAAGRLKAEPCSSEKSPPSRHGDNTWVTLWRQDMGDTFFVKEAVFCGHAVEDSICNWGAVALDQGTAPEPKVLVSGMPFFRHQSQDGLQMERALYSRRSRSIAGPVQTPTTNASTSGRPMDQANWEDAQKTSGLGTQENRRSVSAAKIATAQHTNHWPLAQATGFYPLAAKATSQSLRASASGPDPGAAAQSCMDSGLQGLVSYRQWRALRTFDRARFVQSLWLVGSNAGQSARRACQGRLYCTFSAEGIARSDSDGQRKSFCFARPGGSFAFECLVGTVGYTSGIYAAWVSARQRSPRAVSWGHEKRNNPTCGLDAKRSTASHDPVVGTLQSSASTRGLGTSDAQQGLPKKSQEIPRILAGAEVCQPVCGTPCPKQWRNSVVWSQAIHRRSLHRSKDRTATHRPGNPRSLFYTTVDRSPARQGHWSDAASSL